MPPSPHHTGDHSTEAAMDITSEMQGRPRLKYLLDQSAVLIQAGKLEEAEELLMEAIDIERTPAVLVPAGRLIMQMEGARAALPVFSEAVQKDPQSHIAQMALGDALFQLADARCLTHIALAVTLAPESPFYKKNFLICCKHFSELPPASGDKSNDQAIRKAVEACLEMAELELKPLRNLWFQLFSSDATYQPFYKVFLSDRPESTSSLLRRIISSYTRSGQLYAVFDVGHFAQQTDLKPLCTPFFLNGLRHLLITHIGFEQFLTNLRHRLLDTLEPAPADTETHLNLAAALAVYCHGTEYIFNVTDDEKARVDRLRTYIEKENPRGSAPHIAVYACYAPLHSLENAERIFDSFCTHPQLKDIVECDIGLRKRLDEKKASLTATSELDNDVSLRVRQQYEDFPYPRWQHKPLAMPDMPEALLKEGVRILIAGCGTGREAASAAVNFPRAEIEAIDLSIASLAYAALKAEEFGLGNIRFRHGDILKLEFPDAYFDAIFCHGVLHHMRDPEEGWKSLLRRLKPDGLMSIALYSNIARRHYAAAQSFIAEKGIPGTEEAMKTFRRDAARILPYPVYHNLVTQSHDFYQLSPLRDLLFHEQEHRMTLPQIDSMMRRLGLRLIEMSVSSQQRSDYNKIFGETPDTFENWHKFEEMHPGTFSSMYRFWCSRDKTNAAA